MIFQHKKLRRKAPFYVNNFAPIGRLDKLISPAAIVSVIDENVKLYENGEYGYIKDGTFIIENTNMPRDII